MSHDNFIGRQLESASIGSKATLDNSVKRVLALKPILARILQGVVPEFSNLPIADIENKYIEGKPDIATETVHEGEVVPVITGTNTESSSATEGKVTFDLKFNAVVPDDEGLMQMIINVEGQNKASYPILKRGVYYCGRMLSSQYGTVFVDSHYEKLRKVVSIWICFAGNKKQKNTINRYSLQESKLSGGYNSPISNYNLLDIVMVYIGDDGETDNQLLKMLDKLFNDRYNVEEKKKFLQEDCGVAVTEDVSKEVESMCNYSDYVEERGEKRGEKRGKKLGKLNTRIDDIKAIMKSLNFSPEQAMQALNISKEEQAELLPLI